MNFFLNYERKLILAALCLVSAFVNAQLRFPFTNLSLEELNSKYFFPQSFNTIRVPNPYSDTTSLTPAQCATLFMSMGRASLDSTHVLSDFSGFREHKDSVAHSEGCYSIALLDLEYADFHHDAIDSNWVQRVDGHFYRTEGCPHSPYCIREALVLWVDAPHITQRTYRFLFSSSSFISSYEEDLLSLEINFDDGLGWRILQPNALYDVDYSTEGRNRNIRCRIQREGKPMKYAACMLKNEEEYNPCAHSSFPFPNLPPWNNEGASPWNLSMEVEGVSVACRAYTLTSEDGIFDKPFVFVEGIDFGLDRDSHPIHDTYRHGTFGWCEFTSGFQDPVVSDDMEYGYDDLHKMPELLNAIRAEGYDLVLVDFYDGATWLQHNSELVQQVIRLCNEYKDGNEPLVVAGASMGGVISRHALRTMELNGEDHCARLWISLDAPHEGAHIPLALQHAIHFNAEHGEQQAQLFRDRYLSRPAAKQLLDAQVFNSLIDFESWYGPLREMGYPQTCRRIAISNGRGNGEGLNYQHDELMDWQCSIGALEHTKMLMLPESGDDENPNTLPNMPVLGHFKKLLTGMENMGDEIYFWLGGANLALLDAADIAEQVVYTAEGVMNRDYAPGGKRNTIQTFASSINAALDALSDMESAIANCESVSPEDYNRDHAFVLTGSSVGLQLQDPYTDVDQYLWDHPDEHYFDRVWFASDHNENHTELTDENVEVVLEEVLAQDLLALDSVLTAANPNNGVFNFGRPEFSYLRSIHVHSGGEIRINQFANTHFSQSSDYVSMVNHFEVRTMPCSPELIRIGNGGLLEIGDANTEYRTGALFVGRDSKLQIAAGGRLRINEGSSLVIEEGAILEVLPGGVIEVVSGRIEVMAGGECHFRGSNNQYVQHEIVLDGSDACWLFEGGQLHLDADTRLSMSQNVDQTGCMEVKPGTENMLHMQSNSMLYWSGTGMDDEILRIQNGAHLQNANWMQGIIELSNGKVDLTYNGAIYTDAIFKASNVLFYASDLWEAEGSEVWIWNNIATLEKCNFMHVDFHAQTGKCHFMGCDFQGPNAGFEAFDGAFLMEGCLFNAADCRSSELGASSIIRNSSFEYDSEVVDFSNQDLMIHECEFYHTQAAPIEKTSGRIILGCSHFAHCAALQFTACNVDMSALQGGGRNAFEGLNRCIQLAEINELLLDEGRNDFSGCEVVIMEGSIDTSCSALNCSLQLNAIHNHWGADVNGLSNVNGLLPPPSNKIHVYASGTPVCGGFEEGAMCEMECIDDDPILPERCFSPLKSVSTALDEQLLQQSLRDIFNGSFSGFVQMEVYDLQGKLVLNYVVSSYNEALAKLNELGASMYSLVVRNSDAYLTTKWMVFE